MALPLPLFCVGPFGNCHTHIKYSDFVGHPMSLLSFRYSLLCHFHCEQTQLVAFNHQNVYSSAIGSASTSHSTVFVTLKWRHVYHYKRIIVSVSNKQLEQKPNNTPLIRSRNAVTDRNAVISRYQCWLSTGDSTLSSTAPECCCCGQFSCSNSDPFNSELEKIERQRSGKRIEIIWIVRICAYSVHIEAGSCLHTDPACVGCLLCKEAFHFHKMCRVHALDVVRCVRSIAAPSNDESKRSNLHGVVTEGSRFHSFCCSSVHNHTRRVTHWTYK